MNSITCTASLDRPQALPAVALICVTIAEMKKNAWVKKLGGPGGRGRRVNIKQTSCGPMTIQRYVVAYHYPALSTRLVLALSYELIFIA